MIRIAVALLIALTVASPVSADTARYQVRTVRLTHYMATGNRTFSGEWPTASTAACSLDFPVGTVFVLPQGHIYLCNDRGHLGNGGWLDAFVDSREDGQRLADAYGDYVTARIFLPD